MENWNLENTPTRTHEYHTHSLTGRRANGWFAELLAIRTPHCVSLFICVPLGAVAVRWEGGE